jgi:hypothetical protein
MDKKQENKNLISVNDFYSPDFFKEEKLNQIAIGIKSVVGACNYQKIWQDMHDINPELVNIDNLFPLTETQSEMITDFYTILSQNKTMDNQPINQPTNNNNNNQPNKQ